MGIEKKSLYEIEISKRAQKEFELIKKTASSSVKSRLEQIIDEPYNHPTEGLSVEQLKGKGEIAYSRKLTKKDRIVYVVLEEEKSSYIAISKSLQGQVVL